MSTKNAVAAVAASSLLAIMWLSPVHAQENTEQPTPEMEKEQMDDSAKPDVDPGASKETDEPIPEQEDGDEDADEEEDEDEDE